MQLLTDKMGFVVLRVCYLRMLFVILHIYLCTYIVGHFYSLKKEVSIHVVSQEHGCEVIVFHVLELLVQLPPLCSTIKSLLVRETN